MVATARGIETHTPGGVVAGQHLVLALPPALALALASIVFEPPLPDGLAALFGFAPGEAAVTAPPAALFGPRAAAPITVSFLDWRRERYTSPPGVESPGDHATFGHGAYAMPALGGRLHWASTETAPENPGHIEGALAAAERAARGILATRSPIASHAPSPRPTRDTTRARPRADGEEI